jgi:predicted RNA-binding Zn ribbon-like protein
MSDRFLIPWAGLGTGGHVALDFANTLDWRLRARPVETLVTFSDLLRWAWSAALIEGHGARALRAWGEAHPRRAAAALAGAVQVREAIAVLCAARVAGRALPGGALEEIERGARSAWQARALRPSGGGAAWTWREPDPAPERPAQAVALEAVRLVTSSRFERVRQCGDAECGWFFLDTSRNMTRRWCSMESCGNRNKARRFYRREAARRTRPGLRDGRILPPASGKIRRGGRP